MSDQKRGELVLVSRVQGWEFFIEELDFLINGHDLESVLRFENAFVFTLLSVDEFILHDPEIKRGAVGLFKDGVFLAVRYVRGGGSVGVFINMFGMFENIVLINSSDFHTKIFDSIIKIKEPFSIYKESQKSKS